MSEQAWLAFEAALDGLPAPDRGAVEQQAAMLSAGHPEKELTKWFAYIHGRLRGLSPRRPDPRDLTVDEFLGVVQLLTLLCGIVRAERVDWNELTGGPPEEEIISRAATVHEASAAAQRPTFKVWSAMMELLREERDRRVGSELPR